MAATATTVPVFSYDATIANATIPEVYEDQMEAMNNRARKQNKMLLKMVKSKNGGKHKRYDDENKGSSSNSDDSR